MFDLKISADEVLLFGRFDASQKEKALNVFDELQTTFTVNFQELDYISSAGLSVLLVTQKRLKENNHQLILKNLNKHIQEIFKYAGFHMIFQIE
jgi:anti-anti-sigma factor